MSTITYTRPSHTRNLKEVILWETMTCGDVDVWLYSHKA